MNSEFISLYIAPEIDVLREYEQELTFIFLTWKKK
jgi:hypothetical protein